MLNASELTCIQELQANKDTGISLLQFVPCKAMEHLKILDLAFFEYSDGEGVATNLLKQMLEKYDTDKILKDANKIKRKKHLKVKKLIRKYIPDTEELYKYISKIVFYMLSKIVFKPLKQDESRWCAYFPFHILAKYVEEELKLDGIIYASTRMMEKGYEGYNIVLFNKNAVKPLPDKKIRYIYYSNEGVFEEIHQM